MTNQEFSDEFDLLYNNISSNQAPGLDEYEKSVFLTKALDEIVKSYFNPKLNKVLEGFDGSQRRQIDFSMIIKSNKISEFIEPELDERGGVVRIQYPKEDRIMMFINEFLKVNRANRGNLILNVVQINFMNYSRLMSKPYKRPLQYQAWKVSDSDNSSNNCAEIIAGSNDNIIEYKYRYIKRPRAIILNDLTNEDVSIDNQLLKQECELDPILHLEILQRAVELAKASYQGDLGTQLVIGTQSETNLGMLSSDKNS